MVYLNPTPKTESRVFVKSYICDLLFHVCDIIMGVENFVNGVDDPHLTCSGFMGADRYG